MSRFDSSKAVPPIGRRPKYRKLRELAVGENYVVGANRIEALRHRSAAYHFSGTSQRSFAVRHDGSVWRCWRLS